VWFLSFSPSARALVVGPGAVARIRRADDDELAAAVVSPALVMVFAGAIGSAREILAVARDHAATAAGVRRIEGRLDGTAGAEQETREIERVWENITRLTYSDTAIPNLPHLGVLRDALQLLQRPEEPDQYFAVREMVMLAGDESTGAPDAEGWTALPPSTVPDEIENRVAPESRVSAWAPPPEKEQRALEMVREVLGVEGFRPGPGLLVLAGDLEARIGDEAAAVDRLGQIFAGEGGSGAWVVGEILTLPATRAIALSGALELYLDVSSADCGAAAPALAEAVRERLNMQRPTRPEEGMSMEELLEEISRRVLASSGEVNDEDLPPHARATGWLGTERGAAEAEIVAAEGRLDVRLPPSYREFLLVSDGFGPLSGTITTLRAVSEIGWLADLERESVDAWLEGALSFTDDASDESAIRVIERTLLVGDGDGYVLLIPEQMNPNGEMVTWFFAHWVPGEVPFPSFRAFLEDAAARFVV
jgi:SMI1 / KNR4 family (SUKH-1)